MIVVKIGGGASLDLEAVCDDVTSLVADGVPLVLVHGGAHRTNAVAEALGRPPRFVTSPSGYTSRHTDRAALEVFAMVYCGAVNKEIVERLQRRGVDALGLSGLDGRLWEGRRKAALRVVEDGRVRVLRDGYTGTVDRVDAGLLGALLATGRLPVLTPPAVSREGDMINVDGDRAAAATAAALGADTLVILSDVPGLLRDADDESSLRPTLDRAALEDPTALARGRMRIKLRAAAEALDGGVERVVLGDGRCASPIRRALDGVGTVITTAALSEPRR